MTPEVAVALLALLLELAREGLEARRARAAKGSGPTPLRIVADEGAEALVPPLVAAAGAELGGVVMNIEPAPAKGKRGRKAADDTAKRAEREAAARGRHWAAQVKAGAAPLIEGSSEAPVAIDCATCGAPAKVADERSGSAWCFEHAPRPPGFAGAILDALAGTPDRAPDPPAVDPDPWRLHTDSEGSGTGPEESSAQAPKKDAELATYLETMEEVTADEVGRLRAHFDYAALGMPAQVPSKKDPTGYITRQQARDELSKWAGYDVGKLRQAVDKVWSLRGDAADELERLGAKLPANWRGTLDKLKKAPAHHAMLKLHECIALDDYQRAARESAASGAPPEALARLLEGADADERLSGWGRASAARSIEAASHDAAGRRRGPDAERAAIQQEAVPS